MDNFVQLPSLLAKCHFSFCSSFLSQTAEYCFHSEPCLSVLPSKIMRWFLWNKEFTIVCVNS